MRLSPGVFFAFALGLVLPAGCSSTDFGASNGSAAKKNDDGDGDDDDEKTETDSDKGVDAADADDEDTESDAKAGSLVNQDEAECLLKKGDNFRILFTLDNSGSTEHSDPSNVRRTAALRLVEQFTDFVKANPAAKFSVASLGFSSTTQPGSHGWMKLNEASQSDIDADITSATTNPGMGTHFDKAFVAADPMFESDGASASEKKQRTYMILLSDGKANGDNDAQPNLVSLLTQMAERRGVAVYSILISSGDGAGSVFGGGGFNSPNDANPQVLMPALAVPKTGIVGPDHVGTFVEAGSPEAIDKAFDGFFKLLTGC